MGISWGSLITGAAKGLGAYEQGQRDKRKEQAEAERQARLDLLKDSLDKANIEETLARAAKLRAPEPRKPPTTASIGGKTFELDEETGQWREPVGSGGAAIPQEPKVSGIGDEDWNAFLGSIDPAVSAKLKNIPKASREQVLGQYTASQFKDPTGQPNPEDLIRIGGSLRAQFNQDNAFQSGQQVAASHQIIREATKTPSPAGDIALLTAFMKMIDPRSTVREGEFATAANSGSVPQQIVARYNKLLKGERLSDQQRQDFARQADAMAGNARKSAKSVIDRYAGIATRYNLNPEDVVSDPFGYMDEGAPSDKARSAAQAAIQRAQAKR